MSMMVLEGWQFRLAKELPIFDSVKVALARARVRLGARVRVAARVRYAAATEDGDLQPFDDGAW